MKASRILQQYAKQNQEVFIVSAARTPVGSFRGSLSSLSAVELGGIACRGAIDRSGVDPSHIDEVFMGNVVSANLGQAPATQAARNAGIPSSVPCTAVNKVCASGLKSVMLGALSIKAGYNNIVLAGGMESMSNAPYYLEKARPGFGYGHQQVTDSIIKDGLWDPLYQIHMGNCAEDTAHKMNISRQAQDDHAISSYKRAAAAVSNGKFAEEIVPVDVKVKGKLLTISEDEEFKKVNFDKVPQLKPVFQKDGTVTAANSSTLNDGASAVLLMNDGELSKLKLKPLAKILGMSDANRDPKEFTIAPTDAIKKVLKTCGLGISDISLFEINEAFSVVVLANEKLLGLDRSKVNISGGGVSLGHPIGSSGCRILISLIHQLKKGEIGCAAICNGGGGASALLVEKM